jgi:hypothetical protein
VGAQDHDFIAVGGHLSIMDAVSPARAWTPRPLSR